jgi:hypothetical protein
MGSSWRVLGGVVAVVLVGVILLGVLARRLAGRQPSAGTPTADSRNATAPPVEAPAAATDTSDHGTTEDASPGGDPLDALQAPRGPWAAVDLEAVRAALPNNIYWSLSSPTKDPEVLRQRELERERWNTEYGKVLSNTATAEEVDAYYAHRRRLSTDYIEFAAYILTTYGYQIPPRDVALLKLAADLHLARAEEIPRLQAEAHQRREAHDAARRAWLEDQKTFAGSSHTTP